MNCRTSLIVVLGLLVAGSLNAQTTWSSFQNGGDLRDDSNVPTEWSPDLGISWEQPLAGYGQSSPVVFEDTIYVTSVTGENKETLNVQAISAADGEQKWVFNHANSSPEKNTVMVSRAAPTPVADATGVISFFEGGNLIALDHAGELRWQRDLIDEFGELKARHGLAASLEQDENHIFVWCERMESPYVIAISKSTGETVWKQDGLGSTSWGSPRLLPVGEETHLVLSAMGVIAGLDPASGERLWEFKEVAGNSSATPIPVGEGRFIMGASGGRGGEVSQPSCGVISVSKADDDYAVEWVWTSDKATCSFGSPFCYEGRVYFVNRNGIVHCHDLDSGDQLFMARLPAGQIWATPLAANGLLYFFGKGGVTAVLEPAAELKVVGENVLWSPEAKPENADPEDMASRFGGAVLYAAAIHDNSLLLRRGDRLYCVRASGIDDSDK